MRQLTEGEESVAISFKAGVTSPTETSWFYGPYISGERHRKIEQEDARTLEN